MRTTSTIIAVMIAAMVAIFITAFAGCAGTLDRQYHTDCEIKGFDGDEVITTCGTFEAENNLRLEIGKVYDITTGGSRMGLTTNIPHIVEVFPR